MSEQNTPDTLEKEKSFIQMFRDATKTVYNVRSKDDAVSVIRSLVDNLKSVLTAMDKYLKTKNIDLSEAASKTKEKFTSIADQAKKGTLLESLKTSAKKAKDTVSTKFNETFKSDSETQGAPPDMMGPMPEKLRDKFKRNVTSAKDKLLDKLPGSDKVRETTDTTLSSIKDTLEKFTQKTTDLLKSQSENTTALKTLATSVADKTKTKAASVSDILKDRAKATYEKAKERMKKRQDEVQAEKDGLKKKPASEEKKGFLGKLLSMFTKGITGAISMAFGGLTTVLTKVIGPLIGRAITGTLGFLIPKIIPGIASAIQGIAGAAVRGAAVAGWGLLKGGAAVAGKAALGAATGVVSTIGLPGLVVGAAVAATVFGGYKLYKHLHRNDVGKTPTAKLTRLRLLMYGYSDTRQEHYHRLFDLEMLLADYTQNKAGVVKILPLDKKAKEGILKIFEVQRGDKDRYDLLNTWFVKRFLPSYTAFMSALSQVREEVTLEKLDKLTIEDIFKFASVFKTPMAVFDIPDVPTFEQPKTDVTAKQVEDILVAIRGEVKDNLPKDNSEQEIQNKRERAIKASKEANAQSQAEERVQKRADNENAQQQPKIQREVSTPPGEADQAPDSAKPVQTQKQDTVGSVSTPPVAQGPVLPGNKTLEGIRPITSKQSILSMDPNVLNLLTGMAKEYKTTTGQDIPVTSATRTFEEQQRLYQQNPQKAAKPGTSLHDVNYGLAADIDSKTADKLDELGLMKKYGFTRPIGGETWHIEPAGISLNPAIAKSDPVSRAKRILSSPGRGGGGYGAEKGTPMGKRNMAMQEKLFSAGAGKPVELSKDQLDLPSTATPPILPTSKSSSQTPAVSQGTYPTPKPIQSTRAPQDALSDKESYVGEEGELAPKAVSSTKGKPLDHREPIVSDTNPNMNMGKVTDKVPTSPEQAIAKASKVVGVNERSLNAFAKIESSMKPTAANSQSSAKGLFQFVDGTWSAALNKYGSQYNVPPDAKPQDPYYSAVMAAAYAKDNLRTMGDVKSAGVREDTAMYLGHHFGPGGGKQIVESHKTRPEAPIRDVVSPKAYQSNTAELGNKTVKGYVGYLNEKIDRVSGTSYPAQNQQSQQPTSQVPESVKQVRDMQNNSGLYKNTPKPSSGNNPTYPPESYPASSQRAEPTPQPRISPQPVLGNKPIGAYTKPSELYDDEEYINERPPTIYQPKSQASYEAPLPQPNQALNLNKTESLLTGMGGTLSSIKTILEAIRDNGGMSGSPNVNNRQNTPQNASKQHNEYAQQEQSQTADSMQGGIPGGSPNLRTRSNYALSMSRKPQN